MVDIYETPMLVDVEEACGDLAEAGFICVTGGTSAAENIE